MCFLIRKIKMVDKYDDLLREYALDRGFDYRFFKAIMMAESSGKADVIGDNGKAFGLFQLHLEACQDVSFCHFDVLLDPHHNIAVASQYISQVRAWLRGMGVSATEERIACVYNLGVGHFQKLLKKYGDNVMLKVPNWGYISKVMKFYRQFLA